MVTTRYSDQQGSKSRQKVVAKYLDTLPEQTVIAEDVDGVSSSLDLVCGPAGLPVETDRSDEPIALRATFISSKMKQVLFVACCVFCNFPPRIATRPFCRSPAF